MQALKTKSNYLANIERNRAEHRRLIAERLRKASERKKQNAQAYETAPASGS